MKSSQFFPPSTIAAAADRIMASPRGLAYPVISSRGFLVARPLAAAAAAAAATRAQTGSGKSSTPPAAAPQKQSKKGGAAGLSKELLAKEPALGVNKAYDEALKWFNRLRDTAKSRIEFGTKELESIATAKATFEARNGKDAAFRPRFFQVLKSGFRESVDSSLAPQIEELQKNLMKREATMVKDKAWLWRTDPVREKKARLMLENITAPSVENMTNEEWKAFNADSRVSFLHSPLSFSSSFPLFHLCFIIIIYFSVEAHGKILGHFRRCSCWEPHYPHRQPCGQVCQPACPPRIRVSSHIGLGPVFWPSFRCEVSDFRCF